LREIFRRDISTYELKRSSNLSITGHPNGWLVLAFGFFSETLEMVMATPPRPTDLSDLLHFRPGPHVDPVPWWIFQHLDKSKINELAKISLQRQKEELAAHAKAVDAAMKALG
jgi:hypothetical protein